VKPGNFTLSAWFDINRRAFENKPDLVGAPLYMNRSNNKDIDWNNNGILLHAKGNAKTGTKSIQQIA